MRLSKQAFQDRLRIPEGWRDLESYRLFESCGLVRFPQAGFPLFLPLGKRLLNGVEAVIRDHSEREGFDEVYLPLLQQRRLLESTGRAEFFSDEFFEVRGRNASSFLLAPTNEEVFIDLAREGLSSYRQLPIKLYQIADKFRNVKKPKGILRTRQFLMCDMASIDETGASLRESAASFERVAEGVFRDLGLKPHRLSKDDGQYVSWVLPSRGGETYFAEGASGMEFARPGSLGATAGIDIGMYFLFQHTHVNPPTYQARNGRSRQIFLGTYGFGLQRCVQALIEVHRDELGFTFPRRVRPFDVSVIVIEPDAPDQMELGERCYRCLAESGLRVLLDDRAGKTLKEKATFSDFYGVPAKAVVGRREAQTGEASIRLRRSSAEQLTAPDEGLVRRALALSLQAEQKPG